MPLTSAEGLTISLNGLFRDLIENKPERHQLAAIMLHFETDGDRIAIPRVTAVNLGTGDFSLANGAVADKPATPPTPNVSFSRKVLGTAYRSNKVAQWKKELAALGVIKGTVEVSEKKYSPASSL